MKVPLSWLGEYVQIEDLSAEEIAKALTMKSAETSIERFGGDCEGIRSATVEEIKKSARGDLMLVTVWDGHSKYQVATADGSVEKGEKVLFAPEGARVNGKAVSKKKFGEFVSEGMLISAQDLGLEEKSEGILRLDADTPPGEDGSILLGIGEEILEVDITPNRGDLLSLRGVARDLGAILGREIKTDEPPVFEETGNIEIEVQDNDCRRYRGVIISGITNTTAPLWLRKRLWQCGLRPINAVVDITNYILLLEGQPLHAFDLSKLSLPIAVRASAKGERIVTLDGEERELPEGTLIIADSKGPVAVAGVMGGLGSSVDESTEEILLESAYFQPVRVRKGSSALGLRTESSYRFERNVDIENVRRSQDRAVSLITSICGGKVTAVKDIYPSPYKPARVFLSWGKLKRYAGKDIHPEEVSSTLNALGIENTLKPCGVEAEIPSHRSFDLSRDVDLIEEIMRIKGLDSFGTKPLTVQSESKVKENLLEEIRSLLRAKGLSEVINIPFDELEIYRKLELEEPETFLINPLVPSQRYLRSSLIPGLIRSAVFNLSHYNRDLALFEVGQVFTKGGEEPRLGILLAGTKDTLGGESWNARDVVDLIWALSSLSGKKVEIEEAEIPYLHPGMSAVFIVEGKQVGAGGRLNPRLEKEMELVDGVIIAEITLAGLLESDRRYFRPVSKFPPVHRDLALVVDKNLSVSKLLNEIKSQLGDMVEEMAVFDIYAGDKVGEGKKSVGIRIALRSMERSLSGEEVQDLIDGLVKKLRDRLGVKLR